MPVQVRMMVRSIPPGPNAPDQRPSRTLQAIADVCPADRSPTAPRSGPFARPPVDRGDLFDELLADGVLEIHDPVQVPMKVVTHVRNLLEQPVSCVRQNSPGRSPATSTSKSVPQEGQVTAACV